MTHNSTPGARRRPPCDLPPWLLSLARQIARDCHAPGRYLIHLQVPPHRNRPRLMVIAREERIRHLVEGAPERGG